VRIPGPYVLGGIQFGRISGNVERGDLSLHAGEVILHQPAGVSAQAVPDKQDRLIDLSVELTDEAAFVYTFSFTSRVCPNWSATNFGSIIVSVGWSISRSLIRDE